MEPDGVEFNRASIEVSRIKEDAVCEGVRVQFHASLARARIPMQLDIGFGDVITPGPTEIEYPTLFNFPAPVLRAYPKETVVAEKLEAVSALGLLNSRRKDFYDLALFARMYSFAGKRPAQAVARPSVTEEPLLKSNRLALREHIVMIRHELSNGVHSCVAAASVKRVSDLERLVGEIRLFVLLYFQRRRPTNRSNVAGSQADLGKNKSDVLTPEKVSESS